MVIRFVDPLDGHVLASQSIVRVRVRLRLPIEVRFLVSVSRMPGDITSVPRSKFSDRAGSARASLNSAGWLVLRDRIRSLRQRPGFSATDIAERAGYGEPGFTGGRPCGNTAFARWTAPRGLSERGASLVMGITESTLARFDTHHATMSFPQQITRPRSQCRAAYA